MRGWRRGHHAVLMSRGWQCEVALGLRGLVPAAGVDEGSKLLQLADDLSRVALGDLSLVLGGFHMEGLGDLFFHPQTLAGGCEEADHCDEQLLEVLPIARVESEEHEEHGGWEADDDKYSRELAEDTKADGS